jgi:predicted nucleic acid-binding protein
VSVVIDASVAVKWVLNERGTDAALALKDQPLVAPALWLAEAANALWRHVRLREMTTNEASARLAELMAAPVMSVAIEPHVPRALELAAELNHPVYDCLYLALALHEQAEMVTDDRRLAAAAARRAEFAGRVRLLVQEGG